MIEIKNLSKRFGDVTVLNNISLQADGVLGICGNKESGKSTLLGVIAGVIPATEGQVLINEKELPAEPIALSKAVGFLAEGAPLFPEMTAYEFLTFIGKAKKISVEKLSRQIDEILDLTELSHTKNVYIEHLTSSERKVLGIAQTLLGNPRVVVLDDPFSALDAHSISAMKSIIKMLGEIKTVVLSSKRPADIADVCDKTVLLLDGQLVALDTPEAVALTENEVSSVDEAIEESLPIEDEKEGE